MHTPIFYHLISCLLWVRANIFPYTVLYSYDFDLSLNPHTKILVFIPGAEYNLVYGDKIVSQKNMA